MFGYFGGFDCRLIGIRFCVCRNFIIIFRRLSTEWRKRTNCKQTEYKLFEPKNKTRETFHRIAIEAKVISKSRNQHNSYEKINGNNLTKLRAMQSVCVRYALALFTRFTGKTFNFHCSLLVRGFSFRLRIRHKRLFAVKCKY